MDIDLDTLLWALLPALSLFAALVVAVYLDSLLGGWRTIANRYPGLPKKPAGGLPLKRRFVGLENGGVFYPGITVTVYREGMQLEMRTVMRLFYPPVFLPWKDVVFVSRAGYWLWKRVQLTFAQAPNDPISINARVWNRVLDFVGPVEPKAGLWAESAIAQKPAAG